MKKNSDWEKRDFTPVRYALAGAAVFLAGILGNAASAMAYPRLMNDGVIFDAEYYARANADVRRVCGTTLSVLYNHYNTYGWMERRNPYAPGTDVSDPIPVDTAPTATCKKMPGGYFFDASYYAAANPDVVAVYGSSEESLYQHYLDYGVAEGRAAFDDSNGATRATVYDTYTAGGITFYTTNRMTTAEKQARYQAALTGYHTPFPYNDGVRDGYGVILKRAEIEDQAVYEEFFLMVRNYATANRIDSNDFGTIELGTDAVIVFAGRKA